MDNALGLIIFLFLTIVSLLFFLEAQTLANSLVLRSEERMRIERLRSRESLSIRWIDGYHIVVTNKGEPTVLRYIYVHINGSRSPSLFKELNLSDTNLKTTWSGQGIPLGDGMPAGIRLLEFARPRMRCDHPGCVGKVTVWDDRGVGDLWWEGNPTAARLDDGLKGYSFYVNLSSSEQRQGHFSLHANYDYSACSWIKVDNPKGSGSPWVVLSYQNIIKFLVDPHSGSPRILVEWLGFTGSPIVLKQPENQSVPADRWNYYCTTTRRYWNGTHWINDFYFLVNGRVVDQNQTNNDNGFQPNLDQIMFPGATSMADGAWYDELFAAPTFLTNQEIMEMYLGTNPSTLGLPSYSRFSFESGSLITSIDIVTDLGRVFSSENPGSQLASTRP